MQQWLKEVARGKRGSKDLSYEETKQLAHFILDGKATDAQISAYFIAERIKTESADELLAFVRTLQETSTKLDLDPAFSQKVVDCAGPYTGRYAFAATIPVSILLAEYGIPIFLHSSEALPPKYGISIKAILAELGIFSQPAPSLSKALADANLGFAWTEKYAPLLAKVRHIREEIGVRTLLNTAEKLINIAQAGTLLMGAFHRTAIQSMEPIFSGLPYKRVFIVQGAEGSEDIPVHRNSFIFKYTNGALQSSIIRPKDYGLFVQEKKRDRITAQEQKQIILALLNGEKPEALESYYNQVLFNAGIRYYLFGAASSVQEGIAIAKKQLALKKGATQLEKWRISLLNAPV